MLEYIKHRQKQLEARTRRAAELEAKKEAERVAIIEEEARKQEEIVARKKLLLEHQEAERIHQKHIHLAEQQWNDKLNTLLTRIKDHNQKDDKLEEIRIIIRKREPSLQELGWDSWLLSDPLNQKLADLDFEHAMEMFKRDNLMAKRRGGTRGKDKNSHSGVLSFASLCDPTHLYNPPAGLYTLGSNTLKSLLLFINSFKVLTLVFILLTA